MYINQNNKIKYLNLYFIYLFLGVTLTPVISRNISSTLLGIMMLVMISTTFFINYRWLNRFGLLSINLLIWIVMLLGYQFLNNYDSQTGNLLILIFMWGILILGCFCIKEYNDKICKKLINGYIYIMSINIIYNFFSVINDTTLSKQITGGNLNNTLYKYSNVGNYTYAFLIAITIIIYLYLAEVRVKKRKLYYFMSLIALSTLINMSSTISIVCFFVMVIIVFMQKRIHKKIDVFIYMCIAIMVVVLIIIFKNQIYDINLNIIGDIKNYEIRWRIAEINELLFGLGKSSLSGRTELTKLSIQTFIQNPLWGIGLIYEPFGSAQFIGNHSQIIDDMARYGLLGIVCLMSIYFRFYKIVFKNKNNKQFNKYFIAIITGIILFNLFNTVNYIEQSIVLFLIIPILFKTKY